MGWEVAGFAYRPHPVTELVYGPGRLADLPELLARLDARRPLVITSPSLEHHGIAGRLRVVLGGAVAGVFTGVRPHSPVEVVQEATRLYRECQADILVSVGGGSSVDTAKGVVHFHREETGQRAKHVAIPTTLSGAEFSRGAGITHGNLKKVYRTDLFCEGVLLDPELTLATPSALFLPSGLNAIAHCVEGVCSVRANGVGEGLLLHALRLLGEALLEVAREPGRIEARGRAQVGAALAAMGSVGMAAGLEHALAHVIGGRHKAPHALIHAVLIAPVMRFNHAVVVPQQAAIAAALGVPDDGRPAAALAKRGIDRVGDLLVELGIPSGLGALGVTEADLPELATLVRHDHNFATNPRPVQTDAEILGVLRDAL
jgi:alcohol dehydrogenase class IV